MHWRTCLMRKLDDLQTPTHRGGSNSRQWEKIGKYSHCGGLKGAKNKPQIIWRLISQVPTEKESDSEICNIKNRGFPASSTSQPSSHSLEPTPAAVPHSCCRLSLEITGPSVLTSTVPLRRPWSESTSAAAGLWSTTGGPVERQPQVAYNLGKLPNSILLAYFSFKKCIPMCFSCLPVCATWVPGA